MIRLETQPPPPPGPRRGAQVHDGFYLRLGLGGGYIASDLSYNTSDVPDRSISGGGLALDLLLGGSPARGLVLGGGLWLQSAPRPKTESDSAQAEKYRDVNFGLLGMFIDGFPDPEGGFHVGGELGIATLDASFKNGRYGAGPSRIGDSDGQAAGVGSSIWVGYDAWIAPEWSLGGMLRLSGAATGSTHDNLEQRVNTRAFSILFTALYH